MLCCYNVHVLSRMCETTQTPLQDAFHGFDTLPRPKLVPKGPAMVTKSVQASSRSWTTNGICGKVSLVFFSMVHKLTRFGIAASENSPALNDVGYHQGTIRSPGGLDEEFPILDY